MRKKYIRSKEPFDVVCGCNECGIVIHNPDKWGRIRYFVNRHFNRTRREEVAAGLQAYRKDPINAASISKKLSDAWVNRPRSEINIGILPMTCKWCAHSWSHNCMRRRNCATCPNCHRSTGKIGIKPLPLDPNNPFLFCGDGCGKPIPPSNDGKQIRYLQGHGPKGDILCKCKCGTIIHNPDSSGRFREFVRGHSAPFIELPTKPERKIIQIVTDHSLPFKYTGDGSCGCVAGFGYKPDFTSTLPNTKLIIEVQGTYWHDEESERETKRHEDLISAGYSILYLWDDELLPEVHKQIQSKRKLLSDEEIKTRIIDFIKNL